MCIIHKNAYSDICPLGEHIKCVLRNHFILFVIEIYGCFYSHFDSLLIFCAQVIITRHQQKKKKKFLQCLFLIIDYVSTAFQCGKAIAIFQHIVVLEKHSSSLPHITISAPLLIGNL